MENNGQQPAFPNHPGIAIPDDSKYNGLTKREYLAAMAKTPDFILEQEMALWRGDRNRLPQVGSTDYCKMMKAIASLDSAYCIYKADALLTQLNQ